MFCPLWPWEVAAVAVMMGAPIGAELAMALEKQEQPQEELLHARRRND